MTRGSFQSLRQDFAMRAALSVDKLQALIDDIAAAPPADWDTDQGKLDSAHRLESSAALCSARDRIRAACSTLQARDRLVRYPDARPEVMGLEVRNG